MELNRRRLLRLMGAAGAGAGGLGALAACSSSTQGPPLQSGHADMTLWTHDPGYASFFTEAASDEELVGGSDWTYSIEVTSMPPPDVVSRLVSQAVAQRPLPALAGLELGQFPLMMGSDIAGNLLADLTPLTERFGDRLLKTQPYTVDGKVYALESDNSVSVMYYRADLFEELGIPEDVETWEELLEIGAEVAADTGQAIGMVSDGDNTAIVQGFTQMLLQRGGALYDAEGELTLLSDEAVDALEVMAEGVRSGALLSLTDPYGSATAAALKNSSLIATVMPNWYKVYGLEANVPDQAGLWRARNIPRFAGGGSVSSTMGGTAFGVVKDQILTDAALDFLDRCYLTPEGQLARYWAGAYLPTIADLYETPEFLDITDPYLGDQRIFEVYAVAAEELPPFYQGAGLPMLRDSIGGSILRALKGQIGAEEALTEGVRAYERQVPEQ